MSPVNVSTIGAYIREQREQARISMRQLAQAAGVSNPYLSQIERGLRRPSADILQQLAKGLRISAEALYVQAGFLEDRSPGSEVRDAVLTDPELTERQKQMLIEIYESFRKESAASNVQVGEPADEDAGAPTWPAQVEPSPLARWAIAAEPESAADAGLAEAQPPQEPRSLHDRPEGGQEPPWADSDAALWAESEAGPQAGVDGDAESEAGPQAGVDGDAESVAGPRAGVDGDAEAADGPADAADREAAAGQFPTTSGNR